MEPADHLTLVDARAHPYTNRHPGTPLAIASNGAEPGRRHCMIGSL